MYTFEPHQQNLFNTWLEKRLVAIEEHANPHWVDNVINTLVDNHADSVPAGTHDPMLDRAKAYLRSKYAVVHPLPALPVVETVPEYW